MTFWLFESWTAGARATLANGASEFLVSGCRPWGAGQAGVFKEGCKAPFVSPPPVVRGKRDRSEKKKQDEREGMGTRSRRRR